MTLTLLLCVLLPSSFVTVCLNSSVKCLLLPPTLHVCKTQVGRVLTHLYSCHLSSKIFLGVVGQGIDVLGIWD